MKQTIFSGTNNVNLEKKQAKLDIYRLHAKFEFMPQ